MKRKKQSPVTKAAIDVEFEERDTEEAATDLEGDHSNRDGECFEGGACQDEKGNNRNVVEMDTTSWEAEMENGGGGGGRNSGSIDSSSSATPLWKYFLFGRWSHNIK